MKKFFSILITTLMVIGLCQTGIYAKSNNNTKKDFANLVLFVKFKDDDSDEFNENENLKVIEDTYSLKGVDSKSSLHGYLDNISYGQLNVTSYVPQYKDGSMNVIQLSKNVSDYIDGGSVIDEVVPIAKNKGYLDGLDLNLDQDVGNYIDNLTIIAQGSASGRDSLLTSHKTDYAGTLKINGSYLSSYNLVSSEAMFGMQKSGVIIHEFMHTLGYADLYTETSNDRPVGSWDIMAGTSMFLQWPLAYSRQYFSNWISIDTITTNKTLTLDTQDKKDGNQAYILKSPLSDTEIFVVEFRKKENSIVSDNYDRKIPGSGIIVYRVDTTDEYLSNHHNKGYSVYIFRPQSIAGNDSYDSESNENYAFLSEESGRTSIGSADMNASLSQGALTFRDGSNSGIVIDNVSSSSGDTMSLNVTIPQQGDLDIWQSIMKAPIQGLDSRDVSMDEDGKGNLFIANTKLVDDINAINNIDVIKYDGSSFKTLKTFSNVEEPNIVCLDDKVYVAYKYYNGYKPVAAIKCYENGGWKDIATIDNANDFKLVKSNNEVMLSYFKLTDGADMELHLKKISSGTDVNVTEAFAGQPNVVSDGTNIYVTYRNAKTNRMDMNILSGNTITPVNTINRDISAYTIMSDNNTIYATVLSNKNLYTYKYVSGSWQQIGEAIPNISATNFALSIKNNKIYLAVSDELSKKSLVYLFNGTVWEQLGNNAGYYSSAIDLKIINDQVYVAYSNSSNNKLDIRTHSVDDDVIITDITVTPPTKTQYLLDEEIDTNGLTVTASYSDDSSKVIPLKDCSITGLSTSQSGPVTVTIKYRGLTKTFQLNVINRILKDLTITPPDKTQYEVGEDLNLAGLKVVANYTDGSTKVLDSSEYGVQSSSLYFTGPQNIYVTYKDVKGQFVISRSMKVLKSIDIVEPTKKTYYVGDDLDTTGLAVTATYDDSSTATVPLSSCKIEGYDKTKAGKQTITVTYNSLSKTFEVTVKEKTMTDIDIIKPTKLTYIKGESFDSSGMSVIAKYDNGTSQNVSLSQCTITGFNTNATGNQTIYVSYGGKTKSFSVVVSEKQRATPSVSYVTHIENIGWQGYVSNGQISGTSGQSKRLEGIKIKLTNNSDYSGGIQYRTHIQNIGWQGWRANDNMSGTTGESKRLEAIDIKLTGDIANYYDVYYRVHAQQFGWLDWASNGDSAGTAGYSYRLEAIQVKLVAKGSSAPGSTTRPYVQRYVGYQTHVQNYGWQGMVYDGAMSGTSGQSKRLEGIKITLSNQRYAGSVKYKAHVQNYGWQSWVTNGQMAGTSGQSKRLEAVQIQLTGEMANKYDIYYRVHSETYGWLGWAKNGEEAGTSGQSKRLEAIQIVLINKGAAAPGSTDNHYIKK